MFLVLILIKYLNLENKTLNSSDVRVDDYVLKIQNAGSEPYLSILSSLTFLRLERNDFKESILTKLLPKILEELCVIFNNITDAINNTLFSRKLDVTIYYYTNEYKCSCCKDLILKEL